MIKGKEGVYLTVEECESIKKDVEELLKSKYGWDCYISYHPRYLEIPNYKPFKEAEE